MTGREVVSESIRQITDERAVALIHQVLDGTEWSSDTAPEIADIVKLTGREIREPAEYDETDQAGPLTCERCGARVHNLSADGQCIKCIAGDALTHDAACLECDGHGVIPCDECPNGDECSKCGGTGRRTVAGPADSSAARKHTVFEPCEYHAGMYASEPRYRRGEVMCEGGWANSPCPPGSACRMRPGTDLFAADFVAATPVWYVPTQSGAAPQ